MTNLMGKKWWFFILSLVLILPGLLSLYLYGLRFGIDFTGGTLFEYQFDSDISQDELKQVFIDNKIEVSSIILSEQNSVIIKSKPSEELIISSMKSKLALKYGEVKELRVESVGPVVGGETTKNALFALVLATLMIILYIAFSFRKVPKPASSWRFGVVAVVALLHDVILLVGVFSILGHFLNIEIDILFMTALLTVIGFSVHDTIVVFDRIRENLPKHLSKSFTSVADISIV